MSDNSQKESLSKLIGEINALREALAAQQSAFHENLAAQQKAMAAQQAEFEALRSKMSLLETEKTNAASSQALSTRLATTRASRRKLLKLGGAAASLAALAGLSVAATRPQQVQAADGNGLVIGVDNRTSGIQDNYTILHNPNNTTTLASKVFWVDNSNSTGGGLPDYKIAMAGTTSGTDANPRTKVGVYGATDDGYGVYAQTHTGIAMSATADGDNAFGIFTFASGANGVGISARSHSSTAGYFSGGGAAIGLGSSGADPRTRTDVLQAAGNLYLDDSKNLWMCVANGTPGTWRKLVGPATSGSFHLLPASDRFVDTRPATLVGTRATPIVAGPGVGVNFQITGFAGRDGNIVPNGATAVLGNVTLIPVSAGGTPVKLVPSSVIDLNKGTATVVYTGAIISNSFSAALGPTGALKLIALGSGSFDVTIDIVGYFL